MKPLSPAEHDRLIEEFIRAKGVTKCPARTAFGVSTGCPMPEFNGFDTISTGGYWRQAGEAANFHGVDADAESLSHVPDLTI